MATIRKGTYKFNSTLTQITNQHNLNSALFSFRIDNPDTEVTECTAIFFNFDSETELSDVSYEYSNDSVIAYSKTGGWYPEYQTIIVDETQNVTVNPAEAEDDFWTWFNANAVEVVPEKLSYDLSTSSKWANLSDGSHHVTIVAKADTYRDSKPSIGVDIVKTTSTSETWVLNEKVALPSGNMSAEFKSNNQYFATIGTGIMYSKNYLSYIDEYNDDTFVYREVTNTWVNQDGTDTTAYRTIVFDEPVTDTTLLTWLQANGTKQGCTTSHKLIFGGNAITTMYVNNVEVASGYELTDGDEIRAVGYANATVTINGSSITVGDELTINNQDITVVARRSGFAPQVKLFTINYTTGGAVS